MSAAQEPSREAVARVSDRFEVGERIGAGASGLVWRAHDRSLGLDVALKVLQHGGQLDQVWLKREFRVLADLDHPHLVRLHELFVVDEVAWFTMDLVDGAPVEQLTGDPKAPLSAEQATRLDQLAAELLSAVTAVHEAGCLHRDIKPANLRLDARGRVKVLDYGLAVRRSELVEGELGGTPEFLAPEVWRGEAQSEASDLYAVGATLFALIEGAPPSPLTGQAAKVRREAVPAELAALVRALLDADPRVRLAARARQLRRAAASADERPVGRDAEIGQLVGWLSAAGAARVADLSGPSGIGKSTVARAVGAQCAAGGALVLRSECRRHEVLSYQGLDQAVDQLAEALRALPSPPPLAPGAAGALERLFPVFVGLWPVAALDEADGAKIRHLGGVALAEVISSLARPVLWWVDDAQWCDRDSAELLHLLFARAPNLRALWVRRGPWPAQLPAAEVALELQPLGEQHVRALIRRHVAEGPVEDLLHDAAGSPYLAEALARLRSVKGAHAAPSDLLEARLATLEPEADPLLQLSAWSDVPLTPAELLAAIEAPRAGRLTLLSMRRAGLLHASTDQAGAAFRPYHDRVAEAARARTPEREVPAVHLRLLRVLERRAEAPNEALFRHASAAGERATAGRYALRAADEASTALAFARAASLYRAALEHDAGPRDGVLIKLGEALVSNDEGVQAVEVFREAAGCASSPASERQAALRVAEELVHHGQVDDAIAAYRLVLAAAGWSMPQGALRCTGQILGARACLAVQRSWAPVLRDPPPAEVSARLDVVLSAATGLANLAPMSSQALVLMHLREAQRVAEPWQVSRSLAHEAVSLAALGGAHARRWSEHALEQAEPHLRARGDAASIAFAQRCRGFVGWFRGDWEKTRLHCARSLAICRREVPGSGFMQVADRYYLLSACTWLGEVEQGEALLEEGLADAARRQDRLAECQLSLGDHAWLGLLRGEVDRVRARAAAVEVAWPIAVYLRARLQVSAALVAGDADAAALLNEAWPVLQAENFLYIEVARLFLWHLRAITHLDQPRVVKQARRVFAASELPLGAALGALVEAAVSLRAGQAADALERAERACEAAQLPWIAALARWQRDPAGAHGLERWGVVEPAAVARAWLGPGR